MCKDCGCEEGNERAYFKEHTHTHDGHTHSHEGHSHSPTRTIDVETKVLAENDKYANINRGWLKAKGVVAVNLISSPGSGKTLLLEKTLEALQDKLSCAVITGDQQTDNDAKRMQGKGAPVVQIETRSSCHLNARQVGDHLETVVLDGVKLLFIENVGNLVCPAAFDLGENVKIALLSVTEGEDKPVKYPVLFNDAPVTIITKTDLIPHLDMDMNKCLESVRTVRPDARIFELSSKSGAGMDAWLDYLQKLVQ